MRGNAKKQSQKRHKAAAVNFVPRFMNLHSCARRAQRSEAARGVNVRQYFQ